MLAECIYSTLESYSIMMKETSLFASIQIVPTLAMEYGKSFIIYFLRYWFHVAVKIYEIKPWLMIWLRVPVQTIATLEWRTHTRAHMIDQQITFRELNIMLRIRRMYLCNLVDKQSRNKYVLNQSLISRWKNSPNHVAAAWTRLITSYDRHNQTYNTVPLCLVRFGYVCLVAISFHDLKKFVHMHVQCTYVPNVQYIRFH